MSEAAGDRESQPAPLEDRHRTLKILVAGGVAGAVSRTATAPADRLKMLLMVQDSVKPMSMSMAIQRVALEGSVKAYFRGNGTNVVKIAPETAIKLAASDSLKVYIACDQECIQPQERFLSGAIAGAIAQFTIYPLEVIRTRLAVCDTGTYCGIANTARQIYLQEGWRAFYRGLVPSLVGIIPYAGVDIATFEILMESLTAQYSEEQIPAPLIVGAGMLSSCFAQCVSYPLALTRTRLQVLLKEIGMLLLTQAQGMGGAPVKYNGMLDVISKTIQREGFRGLYKGLLPNTIKLAPAAGISWFVFEKVKQLLGVDA